MVCPTVFNDKISPIGYPVGMYQKILPWVSQKLLAFIHIQLFVSLVSLPILVSWGLPISIMAPVGNLLFAPFLTLFLSISCIIFFTELLYIPNGIFIWCLEQLTHYWQKLLNYGSTDWFLSFPTPSPWFFVALLIATIAVVQHKRLHSKTKSSLCFALLLLIAYGYLIFLHTPRYAIAPIACNNKEITVIKTPQSFTIIDPGVLGRRISAPSWVEYSLLPAIRSTYGIQRIDHLILLAPGIVLCDAVTQLMKLISIQHIYLPLWHGDTPKGLARAYMKMKETALQQGVQLHRFSKRPKNIALGKKSSLTIEPLEAQCAYRTVTYPACKITGTLPDNSVTLYSTKHKIRKTNSTLLQQLYESHPLPITSKT